MNEIVHYMRNYLGMMSEKKGLNFTLLAASAEGLSGGSLNFINIVPQPTCVFSCLILSRNLPLRKTINKDFSRRRSNESNMYLLSNDNDAGVRDGKPPLLVMIQIVTDGRIRWNVHLFVNNCPADFCSASHVHAGK